MNPKLTKPQLHRVITIQASHQMVMDKAEQWHDTIFSKANKNLVYDPRFKRLIKEKELVISHLFRAKKALDQLRGEL